MSKHKIISWTEDKKYSLVDGGLISGLLKKLKVITDEDKVSFKRVLILILITWVPLLIISLLEGTFSGVNVKITFLEDFLVHIRLLIVIPFLILVEKLVDSAYNNYINTTRRIVSEEGEQKFNFIVQRAEKLSNSVIPEILILIIIYIAFFLSIDDTKLSISSWVHFIEKNLSIGGWYYLLIGYPIYQLLIARWLWRWVIWFYTMIKFAFLNLKIEATHADKVAGLEYLNNVPITFGFLFLSVSAIFSAQIGMNVIYFGGDIYSYIYLVLGFIIVVPLILFLPLLTFIPTLIKARIRGVNYFGSLIQYHNNLYSEKWMKDNLTEGESILGTNDNSSMADINGTYGQSINSMSLIPVNLKALLTIIILLLVPFLPLLLIQYSISEIVSKFISIIFS